jgi:hypothetical protein
VAEKDRKEIRPIERGIFMGMGLFGDMTSIEVSNKDFLHFLLFNFRNYYKTLSSENSSLQK